MKALVFKRDWDGNKVGDIERIADKLPEIFLISQGICKVVELSKEAINEFPKTGKTFLMYDDVANQVVIDQDRKNSYDEEALDRQLEYQLNSAVNFGTALWKKFAKQNMKMGITQKGKTGQVRKAMGEVFLALMSGSLYDAMDEARAIPASKKDSEFITDQRILEFINEIEKFLGQGLSTKL